MQEKFTSYKKYWIHKTETITNHELLIFSKYTKDFFLRLYKHEHPSNDNYMTSGQFYWFFTSKEILLMIINSW